MLNLKLPSRLAPRAVSRRCSECILTGICSIFLIRCAIFRNLFIFPAVATDNPIFDLAEEFVSQTSRPVFLTGKAGTGKTTFLKHIKETTTKKTVVLAPTGVAAIHAGGTTIHSFFQLPFTPFIPEILKGSERSSDMSDKYSLLKNMKVESEKRHLFRELELLIIDEVSMVRADILDAVDTVLRHFRRKPYVPFGGVQLLFIGDLFQLPPVVPDDQWSILRQYYQSPFFFHARVLEHITPLYIELKKIYRQTDERFIGILNNIRNSEVEEEDLILLNERYDPDFEPPPDESYITLTTHNYKADMLNTTALERLETPLYRFEGAIEGDFPERNFPTDRILNLKEGAHVMFIKNDMEKVRRYYNGKIGVIKHIEAEKIVVAFPEESRDITVEKDTWKNINYSYNSATHQVEEEISGTFTQYAIRLAWAITIHKSQGLTFQRAIIDAGRSFAPGQVYVALSRCTTLRGIVLRSQILHNSIRTDERVLRFAAQEFSISRLKPILQTERQQYSLNKMLGYFDWGKAIDEIELFQSLLTKRKFKEKEDAERLVSALLTSVHAQHQIAQKFQEQLRTLFIDADSVEKQNHINGRVASASDYFLGQLETIFILPLTTHQADLRGKKKVKGYLKDLQSLLSFFNEHKERIQKAAIEAASWLGN